MCNKNNDECNIIYKYNGTNTILLTLHKEGYLSILNKDTNIILWSTKANIEAFFNITTDLSYNLILSETGNLQLVNINNNNNIWSYLSNITTTNPQTTTGVATNQSLTTTTTTLPKPTKCYTGILTGQIYIYKGTAFTDFDDLVVATLRSRGLATYGSDDGAVYEVPGGVNAYNQFDGHDVQLDCTGTYSGVTKNPFSTFGINVTDKDGNPFFFETSLSNSDSKYIAKVFGQSNFAKPRTVVPLFVEERFQALLTYGWRKGFIRGLNCELTALPNARQGVDPTSIAW
jgi:hypothetical protein